MKYRPAMHMVERALAQRLPQAQEPGTKKGGRLTADLLTDRINTNPHSLVHGDIPALAAQAQGAVAKRPPPGKSSGNGCAGVRGTDRLLGLVPPLRSVN